MDHKKNVAFPKTNATLLSMPSTSDLIAQLKSWCQAERGRSSRLAEHLGVTRHVVSNWLAGRRSPSLDQGLKIQEFLKKEHRSAKRSSAIARDMEF